MPNELSTTCNLSGLSVSGNGIIIGFKPSIKIISETNVPASSNVQIDYTNTDYDVINIKLTLNFSEYPKNKIEVYVKDNSDNTVYFARWYAKYTNYSEAIIVDTILKKNWIMTIIFYNNDTNYAHTIYDSYAHIFILDATKEV